jgi:DNA mismatch repair ATPase MutL
VRLKNYGLEIVEVIDNGIGIPESNYESLGKAYTTDYGAPVIRI